MSAALLGFIIGDSDYHLIEPCLTDSGINSEILDFGSGFPSALVRACRSNLLVVSLFFHCFCDVCSVVDFSLIRGSNSIRSCWSSLEADAPVSGRVDRDLDDSGCVQQRSRQVGSAINQDLVGKIQSLDLLDESGVVNFG